MKPKVTRAKKQHYGRHNWIVKTRYHLFVCPSWEKALRVANSLSLGTSPNLSDFTAMQSIF